MNINNINWGKADRFVVIVAGGIALGSMVATLPGAIIGGLVAAGYGLYINRKEANAEVALCDISTEKLATIAKESDQSRDLFWSQAAFDYTTKQGEIFDAMLPALERYAGKHVLFEDGKVIDSDTDEDQLLDRVWKTDFVQENIKKQNAIFCTLVPNSLPPEKRSTNP